MATVSPDWFEPPVAGEVAQGDLILDVPAYTYRFGSNDEHEFLHRTRNAVVLTQGCDIPKPSQVTILLAEIQSYDDLAAERGGVFRSSKFRVQLIEGLAVADFLIPPCEGLGLGWSVVNFRELFIVPKDELVGSRLIEQRRIGLASPYREHLSQSYARFMMRVGLPGEPLREFEQYKPQPN